MTKIGKVWVSNGRLKPGLKALELCPLHEKRGFLSLPASRAEGCLAACGTGSSGTWAGCGKAGRDFLGGLPFREPGILQQLALTRLGLWDTPIPKGQKAQAQSPPKAAQSKVQWWMKSAFSLKYPQISKVKPQRFCVQLLHLHRNYRDFFPWKSPACT